MKHLSISTLYALASILALASAKATLQEVPPKLSDVLAVAKSPYEPVTLSNNLDEAKNGPKELEGDVKQVTDINEKPVEHKHTTRAQSSLEQEKDTTTNEAQDPVQAGKTETTETTSVTDQEDTESTTQSTEAELAPTTIKQGIEKPNFIPPISTAVPEESTESNSAVTRASSEVPTDSITEASTTSVPENTPASEVSEATMTTSTSPEPTTVSEQAETTTQTSPVAKESVEEVTSEPTSSVTPITEKTTEKSVVSSVTESEPSTTATVPAEVSSEMPTTVETTLPADTTTTTSNTEAPSTSVASSATEAPSTTLASTEVPSLSTAANRVEDEDKKVVKEEKESRALCNHLPTYDSEEIQKVFREETTYKNGTIKGKFTYINFDQRYRLVHYTRLPYGPVKIDHVEELGKVERAPNNPATSTGSSNDAPNSVLQLRNIIPNSLFGFPFVGQSPPKPTVNQRESNEDRPGNYFYSTDSLPTPNLFSPNVPVSIPPNQQRAVSQPINSPSFAEAPDRYSYDNLQYNTVLRSELDVKAKQEDRNIEQHQQYEVPTDQQQIQANAPVVAEPKQAPLVYTYLSQAQPQYHYSPVPVYNFHQPTYHSARQPFALQPRLKDAPVPFEPSVYPPIQQHSFEHYVAPLTFAQPASSDQADGTRLKLKVKTSKALNMNREPSGRSAQLRAYSSPAQIEHQRQRAGKQNQELRPTVNTQPVVYHILRSPSNKLYNLQQYNQATYSMAYDHES